MIGPLIAAGASLASGLLARDAQKDANATAQANADRNIALQREFAQSGIQWKVADARKAGIHPLFALGASTTSFAPVSVGTVPETGIASGVAAMGQDVGRAINSTRSATDRVGAVTQAAQSLQLENMGLQNQLLASQIRKINQVGPAMPTAGDNYIVDGQGETVLPKDKPLERIISAPGQPQSEHAAIPDVGWARTATGWAPVPSKDVKERIEDMNIQEFMWTLRNNVSSTLGGGTPPPFPPPEGFIWAYHPLRQEWQLADTKKKPGFDWGYNPQ